MKAKIPKLSPQQVGRIFGDDVSQPVLSASAGTANPLAGMRRSCADSPRMLISLWDFMTEILPKVFHDALHRLSHDIKFSAERGTREATSSETVAGLETIDDVRYHCLKLGLKESEGQCDKLNNWLKDASYHLFPPGGKIPPTPASRSRRTSCRCQPHARGNGSPRAGATTPVPINPTSRRPSLTAIM